MRCTGLDARTVVLLVLALVRRRLCSRLRTRRSVNDPYAGGAPMRGLRVWNNVHPLARTNNTPMTQAVQAAELSAAQPRTQGAMNNKTPRMRESPLKHDLSAGTDPVSVRLAL